MASYLTLDPHSQPQVRHGGHRLWPVAMTEGKDRLAYLRGVVAYAAELLSEGGDGDSSESAAALRVIGQVPFARELVEAELHGKNAVVRARPGAERCIAFHPDALAIALLDGRDRRNCATSELDTGAHTPAYARLFQALARGVALRELHEIAVDVDLEEFLRPLTEGGHVHVADGRRERAVASGTRVTWHGHAFVVVEHDGHVVWVDPLLFPRISWTATDRQRLFHESFAERLLIEGSPHLIQPAGIGDLPTPDWVLITHQDCDHFDLGSLMLLPKEVEIVVPRPRPDCPWDVDLAVVVGQVLGSERRVRHLGHFERLDIGPLSIEAFPFRGEMPANLPHGWNCYLVATKNTALAFAADSRLDDESLEFLVRSKRSRLLLFAGPIRERRSMPGWREGLASAHLLSSERLWGWYVRPVDMFAEVACANVTPDQLADLVSRAGLVGYFPYATGSAPWFRIDDPDDAFSLLVSSLDRESLMRIQELATGAGCPLFPCKLGLPVVL